MVLEKIDLVPFNFWKVINAFLMFDPQMPLPLKRHFRNIEIKIVSQMGWSEKSPIVQFIKNQSTSTKKSTEKSLNKIKEDVKDEKADSNKIKTAVSPEISKEEETFSKEFN